MLQGYDETMMDSSLGGGGTPSADGNKGRTFMCRLSYRSMINQMNGH